MDLFVRDPQHAGKLSGIIDFPPLETAIPFDQGVFNLFQPGEASGEKWMVYELGFRAKARPYYLAGKKVVLHDHGTEVVQETTTLYTILHEGSDSSGAVAGAGVLHLGVKSLADLAKTIQITNAQNSFETMRGLEMYLKLFLGELWQTYVKCGRVSIGVYSARSQLLAEVTCLPSRIICRSSEVLESVKNCEGLWRGVHHAGVKEVLRSSFSFS